MNDIIDQLKNEISHFLKIQVQEVPKENVKI